MSFTGIVLRIIRRIKILNQISQHLVRRAVSKRGLRRQLNKLYRHFDLDQKGVFHNLYCRAFRESEAKIEDGIWKLNFLDSEIKMPLRTENIWLDWDNAVSICGHDIDIKQTYECILKSPARPRVFFDVGANYGTHSLLFLKQNVTAIAFEPNPDCREQFELICSMNGVSGRMENSAVGDKEKTVAFWFPETETWLGSIVESTRDELSKTRDLKRLDVPLTTLDNFAEKNNLFPDLIKIDTEGNELNVIKGAVKTMKTKRPLMIFECNHLSSKENIWQIFEDLDYSISKLPLESVERMMLLSRSEFLSCGDFNFIAAAKKRFLANS